MIFHIEERRAWLRPRTHTVILDQDPAFERFSEDRSGAVERTLRIWLAEPSPTKPVLRAYLGAVRLSTDGASPADLVTLFRRTSEYAPVARESSKALRRRLARSLRDHLRRTRPGS